jgi:hypothetical protein
MFVEPADESSLLDLIGFSILVVFKTAARASFFASIVLRLLLALVLDTGLRLKALCLDFSDDGLSLFGGDSGGVMTIDGSGVGCVGSPLGSSRGDLGMTPRRELFFFDSSMTAF